MRRMHRLAARTISTLAVTALCAAAACRQDTPSSPSPNVLLLVLDTLRADRCGVFGWDRGTTPSIDALARESTSYADCWAPASWTVPSHATLFTGYHPVRHGVHRDGTAVLRPEFDTLAERLAGAGWATASISNNPYIAPEYGLTQGFGDVTVLGDTPGRHYPWARDTHARGLAWMLARREEGKRFFLFMNDFEPHYPYRPPRDVERRFVRPHVPAEAVESIRDLAFPRSIGLCVGTEAWKPGERDALSDLYDAEVAALDAEVGELLTAMRTSGLLEDTMVILTSDHGEGLGEHRWIEHGNGLHRELLRVPLVVRDPGPPRPGRTVDRVVGLQDVAPTILQRCGLAVPRGLDGASLDRDMPARVAISVSAAYDSWADIARRAYPTADLGFMRVNRASAFDGRWHLIADGSGALELFDVKADPAELHDVAAAHADVVARLRQAMGEADPLRQ